MSFDSWRAVFVKLSAAAGLWCLFGCDEATLSLFPQRTDASAGANAVPTPPDLLGYWPLDTDGRDLSASNDGTLVGGATFVDDPTRGKVLSCDGMAAGFSIKNETPLDFTYALWVWTDAPSQGDDPLVATPLLWSNVTGDSIDDFTLALVNDRLMYLSYGQTATGTGNLVDASWHHVVLTRQNAARVEAYVDGQVDGDGNSSTGCVTANPFVYLCANPNAGSYFAGKLDDLRLYNRVLLPSDVEQLYEETRR